MEYICLGCNEKEIQQEQDNNFISNVNQKVAAILAENDTQSPQMSINGNSNNTDLIDMTTNECNTEKMELESSEQLEDHIDKTLGKIDEEPTPLNIGKKKKYPVAPGDKRITPIQGNTNHPRPNKSSKQGTFLTTRLELRVNVQSTGINENNLQKLRRHLVDIIDKLIESDNELKVIPWKENTEYREIDANSIPTNQPGIASFFNRINPRQEGFVYADIRIKHRRIIEDIINDTSLWLSNQKHGMYFQTLQSESITNIGWLLWSFRRMDLRKLEDEIWKLYNINIALKYQTIATSINGGDKGNTEIVKALHIWTTRSDADRATRLFNGEVYSYKAVHFPLGIVLRFIPQLGRITDHDRMEKYMDARSKQQTLLNSIESNRPLVATSWEILTLDQAKGPYSSLRKILMGIESKRLKGEHLFLSVDVSYFRRNEVLFSFLPRHENEARDFVAQLVPYILNTHAADEAKSFFYPDAVERALVCEWDSGQQQVVSFIDKYMDEFEILDDYGDDIPQQHTVTMDLTAIKNTTPQNQAMAKVERLITGEETDSIGTMLTSTTQPLQTATNTISYITGSTTVEQDKNMSAQSITGRSITTTMTQEQMESNILLLHKSYSTMENFMQLIANHLGISQGEGTSQINDAQDGYATSPEGEGCTQK